MSKNQKIRPKNREEALKAISARIELNRKFDDLSIPIPDENLPEIMRLTNEREKALEYFDGATNLQEIKERAPVFIEAHKKLLRAYGLKPCTLDDCTRWLTGRRWKYCSDSCREKEKARRKRRRDPAAHKRAIYKDLQRQKKAGDF